MRLDIKISSDTPRNCWYSVALNRAHEVASNAEIDWLYAYVYIELPEQGRYFLKRPGEQGLEAHG